MNDSLLISIITPSLNRAGFISQAIESVRSQDYPHVEHIIVDGGSTDGTLALLANYPYLRVVSEPDQGIYDALNKGLRQARGQLIGFLNTDDHYAPGIFGQVAGVFAKDPSLEALVGGATFFSESPAGSRATLAEFPGIPPGELLLRLTVRVPIFNAWFFHRRVFDEQGGFDTRFSMSADRDFLLRLALRNHKYEHTKACFYHYRRHAGSFTLNPRTDGEAGFVFENRSLAERYLEAGELDRVTRRRFRDWHAKITTEQVLMALRRQALGRAAGYASRGLRYNSAWPLAFVKWTGLLLARSLSEKIGRRFQSTLRAANAGH